MAAIRFLLSLGVAGCGAGVVSYSDVIAHWFDRYRGLALGFTMLGLGAGALITPSVAQYLIARFGWRLTFGIVGAAMLVITLPVVTTFLAERPEPRGLLPDGSSTAISSSPRTYADPGLDWRKALRVRTFWLLFCAFVLISASVQACLTHITAIFTDRGIPAQTAALATSLFGGGLLIGRAGSGYLLDRFFAPRVAAVIFCCAALGMGVLAMTGSRQLAFVATLFVGLGLGAEVDTMAYLTSRYFGLRSFGTIYGFAFAGFGLAGGFGAYLMGAAYDAAASYTIALVVFCMATLVGAALMMCLGPYRYQVRAHGESGPELQMLLSES